jgi:hypothetical protein
MFLFQDHTLLTLLLIPLNFILSIIVILDFGIYLMNGKRKDAISMIEYMVVGMDLSQEM